ncbi:unnamed protein product [Vicia faba]|uniref:Basic leucine-zipper C-terminal domain-containing protein n=1 Tax=Vicia faba TaxID=3906 RepID=A0AAV0ZZW7_VICFA|nr:unnamed protein product [Vicia faba]
MRIPRRNLYQFCNEYAVPRDITDNVKKVTPQDIVCSQKNGGVMLKEEDVAVSNVKIDLTRGKHNPLESIHFFKDYESDEKFTIPDERISHLLPASYQDMIVRVYSKKLELEKKLQRHGIKTQVSQLRGENSSLVKRLTNVSQKYTDSAIDNRVLKADVETLRAKVKMAEETVKRIIGLNLMFHIMPDMSSMGMPSFDGSPSYNSADAVVPVQDDPHHHFYQHA